MNKRNKKTTVLLEDVTHEDFKTEEAWEKFLRLWYLTKGTFHPNEDRQAGLKAQDEKEYQARNDKRQVVTGAVENKKVVDSNDKPTKDINKVPSDDIKKIYNHIDKITDYVTTLNIRTIKREDFKQMRMRVDDLERGLAVKLGKMAVDIDKINKAPEIRAAREENERGSRGPARYLRRKQTKEVKNWMKSEYPAFWGPLPQKQKTYLIDKFIEGGTPRLQAAIVDLQKKLALTERVDPLEEIRINKLNEKTANWQYLAGIKKR